MIANYCTPGSSITLAEAAVFVAETTGCRKPHINTVFRWVSKGVRGNRLHAVRVGRTFWTTREAVSDFLMRLNAGPATAASPVAADVLQRQRDAHARRVRDALADELGIADGAGDDTRTPAGAVPVGLRDGRGK